MVDITAEMLWNIARHYRHHRKPAKFTALQCPCHSTTFEPMVYRLWNKYRIKSRSLYNASLC